MSAGLIVTYSRLPDAGLTYQHAQTYFTLAVRRSPPDASARPQESLGKLARTVSVVLTALGFCMPTVMFLPLFIVASVVNRIGLGRWTSFTAAVCWSFPRGSPRLAGQTCQPCAASLQLATRRVSRVLFADDGVVLSSLVLAMRQKYGVKTFVQVREKRA